MKENSLQPGALPFVELERNTVNRRFVSVRVLHERVLIATRLTSCSNWDC
jgi:hypothetical protein